MGPVYQVRIKYPGSITARVVSPLHRVSSTTLSPSRPTLTGNCRWFALIRPWTPWLAPRQGKSSFELDKDALLCSFLSPQGKHLVFLGTGGANNVSTILRSGDSGSVVVSVRIGCAFDVGYGGTLTPGQVRNDNTEPASGTVLVAVGDNIESTIAAVMYQARSLLPMGDADADRVDPFAEREIPCSLEPSDDPKDQWYETWPDGLGYCEWKLTVAPFRPLF